MTIRQRLTLWYGSILLLSVLLPAAMMYFELIVEPDGAPPVDIPTTRWRRKSPRSSSTAFCR
ncbi:MAG: hypothetical protein AB7O66_07540 [Limisphaerales bacterium]